MEIYCAKQILDLDEFLPPDGEDRVDIFYEGGSLRLEVFYELVGSQQESRRIIEFVDADYFVKSPFPGYSLFSYQKELDISLLNSLIEYKKSDLISKAYGDDVCETRKHYRIIFHSVEMVLHVISSSCKLS